MTGKERAQFRAQANSLEPVFQIGKGGVSDALIKQTNDALKKRELIKIKALLESIHETPKELADMLSEATGAVVIQVIGGSIVLFKENPELRAAEKEKAKRKKEALKKAKLKSRLSETKKYPRQTQQTAEHGSGGQKKSQTAERKTSYRSSSNASENRGSYNRTGRAAGAKGVSTRGSHARTKRP